MPSSNSKFSCGSDLELRNNTRRFLHGFAIRGEVFPRAFLGSRKGQSDSNLRPLPCQGSKNSPQPLRTSLRIALDTDIHVFRGCRFGAEYPVLVTAVSANSLQKKVHAKLCSMMHEIISDILHDTFAKSIVSEHTLFDRLCRVCLRKARTFIWNVYVTL